MSLHPPHAMLSSTMMLGAAAAAAALLSVAQSCDISGNVASVLDVQCRICQFATEAECLGGGTNATIHGSCSWTPGHGCRPSAIVVPFVNLLNEEEYYQTALHMVQYQENCTGFMTEGTCTAGFCDWGTPDDEDVHDVMGQVQCRANGEMFLSILLSFVYELSYLDTLMWTARNERCQGLTPDGPNGGCADGSLAWAGSATPETDLIFPCNEDDGKCVADAQNTIRGMSFNAALAGSALKAAFKAQVTCKTVYRDSNKKPGFTDDQGSWVWTPTPGNPGTQTVLSGPFGSPNDCARAVNRECPTHTYAYYTEDAEDASNHACACQTILGTVVRNDSAPGSAMYLGISACQTAGVNCTQMCVDNPFCRADSDECEFDDDAVQSFPAGFSDTFLGPTTDPILAWQVAASHCTTTDCKAGCEATLGGECEWDDESPSDSQWVRWGNTSVAAQVVPSGDTWSKDDCANWAMDDRDCAADGFPILFYQDADPLCTGHCPPYCACGQNVDGSQTPPSNQTGATGWAAWIPTAGECSLNEIVWPMDEMSEGRTAWVKPFIYTLFGECEDLENRTACIAVRGDHGSRTCRWQSTVSGAGDGGGCVPRMEAAFIPALPNSGHCAGALSDIADTFTGCLANPNETSCNAGTHYMHANDTHDSVHVCEWSCGQCVPSTAFAESLDTAQYPVAAAFMPNDGECTCAAAVAVCPSRPPTAGIVTVMTASPVGVALTAPPVEGAAPNAPPTAPPVSSSPVDGAPAPAPTTPATYIVVVSFPIPYSSLSASDKETMLSQIRSALGPRLGAAGLPGATQNSYSLAASLDGQGTDTTVILPAGTTAAQSESVAAAVVTTPIVLTNPDDSSETTSSTGASSAVSAATDNSGSAASDGDDDSTGTTVAIVVAVVLVLAVAGVAAYAVIKQKKAGGGGKTAFENPEYIGGTSKTSSASIRLTSPSADQADNDDTPEDV